MERLVDNYLWQTLAIWLLLFVVLVLINGWMRNNLQPARDAAITESPRRVSSTITALETDRFNADSDRPHELVSAGQQLLFLLAVHVWSGTYLASINADGSSMVGGNDWAEELFWLISSHHPERSIATGIALVWLLAVAYASLTERRKLLAMLTYANYKFVGLILLFIFLPIPLLIVLGMDSFGGGGPGISITAQLAAFLPSLCLLTAWLSGRYYRRAYRRYARLPMESTPSRRKDEGAPGVR